MIHWLMNLVITSMIFFPEKGFYATPDQLGLAHQDVVLETPDSIKLHSWFIQAPDEKGVVLFLHGNAGNISGRLFKAKGWIQRGYSVLLLDYRGYGRSEGKIKHERDVYTDAETAAQWLKEKNRKNISKIVLYGESLGSAPAVKLAAEGKFEAVILESPFTSFFDLADKHYPMIPKFFVNDFAFANIDRIAQLQTPLFILHGTKDDICPFEMGETLFDLAPEPKFFFEIPGGSHNNLPDQAGQDYWDKPVSFLQKDH